MTTGYYELDKLTFLQRQKYDHLFHLLYGKFHDFNLVHASHSYALHTHAGKGAHLIPMLMLSVLLCYLDPSNMNPLEMYKFM